MKKVFPIFATLLVITVGGCAPQVDVEAERAAIHKFHDECMTAILSGNVDCFAEEIQLLPRDAPPIKGKKAMGELVSQMIEDPNFSFSHDIVNVEVSRSGDLAYIHYTYELIMSDPGGNSVTEHGKAIYTLKKQPQAEWKFLIDIWNTDSESMSDTIVGVEQMTVQAKVEEQNKASVRRILAEGDKENLEFLDEVGTSDYKFYFPSNATPINVDEHKELWRSFNLAFPDLTHTIKEIYADGEVVVARLILSGTHEGEFAGMPPTGKEVEFSAIEIFRFSEGKLAEFWSDGDILSLQQQLGMELRPKEGEND